MRLLPNLQDLIQNCDHFQTTYGNRDDRGAFTNFSDSWVADANRSILLQRAELCGVPFLVLTWANGHNTTQFWMWRV